MLVRPHWTTIVAHKVGSGLRESVAGDTLGP
jgi:hypothetical protein